MNIDGLGKVLCVECHSPMRLKSKRPFDTNTICYFFVCSNCDHMTVLAPRPEAVERASTH